ncbi:MAG: PorT family protein [Cyclobacteriaceae bacterium]|nr:PorT family protein [Cyclobacteriaceae bacterium]MDW8332433.1 porin family protein [Cyclobacteriaceae bacterium]
MKKFIFTTVAAVLLLAPAWGQIHIGATTGLNATFVLDKGLKQDPRYNSTYTYQWAPVGFSFGVNLGRKLGLQLESILSNQGQLYEVINTAEEIAGKRDISLQYINLPVLLQFMGGGSGKARTNFNFGPQLGLLTKARELVQFDPGTYTKPDDPNFELPPGAIDNGDGTYTLEQTYIEEFTKAQNDFKNAEFQIALGFGLDVDLSKHLYLSTQVRINYSLTDMRNQDVIDAIRSGNASDIFGGRANALVGIQMGLHYMFGSTRSFKGR